MTGVRPHPQPRRAAWLAAAAALLAAAAIALAGPARAEAASCSGTIGPTGQFSFSCDSTLGAQGVNSFLFVLTGSPARTTLISATVASPAGVTCVPIGLNQRCFGPNQAKAGSVIAGSATRAEGPFCASAADPGPEIFTFPTSGLAASYAGALGCPVAQAPPPHKNGPKGGGAPREKCVRVKKKGKRKKCRGKKPKAVPFA